MAGINVFLVLCFHYGLLIYNSRKTKFIWVCCTVVVNFCLLYAYLWIRITSVLLHWSQNISLAKSLSSEKMYDIAFQYFLSSKHWRILIMWKLNLLMWCYNQIGMNILLLQLFLVDLTSEIDLLFWCDFNICRFLFSFILILFLCSFLWYCIRFWLWLIYHFTSYSSLIVFDVELDLMMLIYAMLCINASSISFRPNIDALRWYGTWTCSCYVIIDE